MIVGSGGFGYPTPWNHRKWNIDENLLSLLRIGIDDGWIQGIAYFSNKGWETHVCTSCKGNRARWQWEWRVSFCDACVEKYTIRYAPFILFSAVDLPVIPAWDLPRVVSILIRNVHKDHVACYLMSHVTRFYGSTS
jgi:hypothetical protein